MTRAQYVALCLIGALAAVAFLQSNEVARAMRAAGVMPSSGKETSI